MAQYGRWNKEEGMAFSYSEEKEESGGGYMDEEGGGLQIHDSIGECPTPFSTLGVRNRRYGYGSKL